MSVTIQRIGAVPPPAKLAITVACTSLGFFIVQLDGSVLNVALPQIGVSLGAGVSALQWTVDAYFLTFSVLLLSAGVVSDRLGARNTFIAGFTVFSVASLACAVASSELSLVAARALQGLGAALLVPCSLALLNSACGDDTAARARAVGLWTAAGGVALAAGPVVGGFLAGFVGWRSVFLVNLPIGLIGIAMTALFLGEAAPVGRRGRFHLGAQALACTGLVGLINAIIEAGRAGWGSPLVVAGLVVAAVAGAGFVAAEAKSLEPMIPRELRRQPVFAVMALVGFFVNFAVFGLSFAQPIYFQRVLMYSPVATGLAFVPFALIVTLSNVLGGRVAARFGFRLPIIGGLFLAASGYALLVDIGAATTYVAMLPSQLLIRIGIGLVVPSMTSALLSAVDSARSGTASGVLNAVRQAGGATGVALFGALMAGDLVRGMQWAFIASAAVLCVAGIVTGLRLRPPAKDHRR